MRQVQVQAPLEGVDIVLRLAREHGARAPVAVTARERAGRDTADGALAFVDLPNDHVGSFVEAVQREVDGARFVLVPIGALPLASPLDRIHARVADVSRLSTLELVLGSLQSVGSFRGLVLFSIFAGIIGAYGLVFEASYLLVAAMLINPMGAPALVSVIAAAVGDPRMFGRGTVRFGVSLVLQAAAAMAVGFGYRLDVSTGMIEQVTSLSVWVPLVALAAGAAGAQSLVKSDRDSLVTGTAAGFMVAAALAPPAAVLGLSVPLARWDYAELMGFLLLLQFAAIGVGGFGALTLFGVRTSDATVGRGRAKWRGVLLGVLLVAAGVLVAWQTAAGPRYVKADLSRRALEITRTAVQEASGAALVDSDARFVSAGGRENGDGAEALLVEVTLERQGTDGAQALSAEVREAIRRRVEERAPGVTTYVDVTVLPGP